MYNLQCRLTSSAYRPYLTFDTMKNKNHSQWSIYLYRTITNACNILYFYTSYSASILILGFDSLKRYALRLSFPNHTFYWNTLRLLKQKESVK